MRRNTVVLTACCNVLLTVGFATKSLAQARLYATGVNTKGYVAGQELSASGLYMYEGEAAWRHIGWNHPRVYGIAFHPTDPNVLYLACGNGVLRTRDGGRTWKLTTDWRVTEALSIAVDPHAPEHVYVATAYGLWRTADGGDTWVEASLDFERTYTQTVAVDRTKRGRVLAGTEGGVYLSRDGGESWERVSPPDVAVLDLKQSFAEPGLWVAGMQEHGVWLSRDGGTSWHRVGGNLENTSVYAAAVDPSDTHTLAAVVWDQGVFLSRNGGRDWTQIGSRLPTQKHYDLTFDPTRKGRLWVATVEQGVFSSDDFGRTWVDRGLHGVLIFDLTFGPEAK